MSTLPRIALLALALLALAAPAGAQTTIQIDGNYGTVGYAASSTIIGADWYYKDDGMGGLPEVTALVDGDTGHILSVYRSDMDPWPTGSRGILAGIPDDPDDEPLPVDENGNPIPKPTSGNGPDHDQPIFLAGDTLYDLQSDTVGTGMSAYTYHYRYVLHANGTMSLAYTNEDGDAWRAMLRCE